ncbi:MAG TPA: hypothetical protein VNF72_18780, partial [Myxococcota bacterium]|nr:hypothetical protein [Myxococcota bacterium]
MKRMRRLAVAGFLLALVGVRAEAQDPPASFDYVYIRAHEASASGGHAAIRFGRDTFDFQHVDGWLAVRRENARRFQYSYRTLQNRS